MDGKTKDGNGKGPGDKVWLIGAKTIAAYIGVDHREIPELVTGEGLPAFIWRGAWRALPEEIQKWSAGVAAKCRRNRSTNRRRAPTGRPLKVPESNTLQR